jgi:hypothetical protein
MRKVLANPAEMIARGAPRLIHNDEELAAYTEALFELTALAHPSRSQVEAIGCSRFWSRTMSGDVTLSLPQTRFRLFGSSSSIRALHSVI